MLNHMKQKAKYLRVCRSISKASDTLHKQARLLDEILDIQSDDNDFTEICELRCTVLLAIKLLNDI